MKTIDIFANMAGQALEDGHIQKYGAILLRSGMKGVAKVNPAVVWIEATLAVVEAAGAFFRYCAATETTAQLRQLNKTLESTLVNDLQIAELELQALFEEQKGRRARIERALIENQMRGNLTQQSVREKMETLKRMHDLLQEQRLQSGGFQELIGLQVCLDSCIDASLALLLNLDGQSE